MRIQFLGAAREVTGSCTLLNVGGKNYLVDCGMEQGPDTYENITLPVAANDIDCVFLTHAHIDHSGKIPFLVAQGFRGKIFCTGATAKLCGIMLRDSAHIQEFEAAWRNRKAKRAGEEEYTPLYTLDDAEAALKLFCPCEYNEETEVSDFVKIEFIDAGHLLGSSSIKLTLSEGNEERTVIFSGDIGNDEQPLLRDPHYPVFADTVIMESTYGDRSHGERIDYISQLVPVLQRTFDRGGNVVIPSFAVGRTQELLYFFRIIKEQKLIKGHDNFPVYVDSPLAIEATNIFSQDMSGYFDETAMALINKGINPISFSGLITTVTSDDSKAINADERPKVIISASGMCEAGRVRHHLKHNLWRENSTILFVGYQAEGTLGRILLGGAKTVRLFNEEIRVCADIESMRGISGHADDAGLLKWISSFKEKPSRVFVNHGQDEVAEAFSAKLRGEGFSANAPYIGSEYDLITGKCLSEGNREKITRAAKIQKRTRATAAFERLESAGRRLLAVISHNRGGSNKDLAKFTDQINSLCGKWDR